MEQREQGRATTSIFAGRRALVVGGSGGIGSAVALDLASRGASILIHGKSELKVDAVVRAIAAAGGQAESFACPITRPGAFLAELERFGSFDIVVVAFGPFLQKPLAACSAAEWEDMALLNLALPGALASRYFPAMSGRGFGRFLFFGGTRTDSIRGFTSNAAYAAAKTGLGVLAKSIAIEGAPHNVAAITVCPGLVRTEYISLEQEASLIRMAPGGRLSSSAVVASTALDLIAGDPCLASGAIVSLDSGFSPPL
ncbi:MAG: short-chain dehydrogenase [Spirochaetae bacterium HGW-Spirochaetae-9]|nr:MAG: short-chain dehydrogenase [Spirochaetae bacterium HGW-Spirochaetae-9]